MKTLRIVYHYFRGEDLSGDYEYITVENIDGNLLKRYGDYYHDKGSTKASAFVEGYSTALEQNIKVEVWHTNDGTDYDKVETPIKRKLIRTYTIKFKNK